MNIQRILGAAIIVAEIACLYGYIPQYLHLIKTKNSSGINIQTWTIWMSSAFIFLAYAISIKNIYLVTTGALTVIFEGITLILTIKYRPKTMNFRRK